MKAIQYPNFSPELPTFNSGFPTPDSHPPASDFRLLVLDNYDSFTYNLVHIVRSLGFGKNMEVIRNDQMTVDDVANFDKILLSPGPGIPDEAGIMKQVISTYAPDKSILGICLGHQGIAEVFGAELFNMSEVLHGVGGTMKVDVSSGDYLFDGVPESFSACHYHSWSVRPESANGELKITAKDTKGNIMGLAHTQYDVRGLQFHPESILTEHGEQMIKNWITH